MFNSSTAGYGLHIVQFTVEGGRVSGAFNEQAGIARPFLLGDGRLHLRLLNDGSLLHFQISPDGIVWGDWYAIPSPSGMTNYGFWMGSELNSGNAVCNAMVYECSYGSSLLQAAVTNATNATPIVYSSSGGHPFQSGDWVSISGINGGNANNANTNTANNDQLAASTSSTGYIMTVSGNNYTAQDIAGNTVYTSGGTATCISR
jgi:hypothetical protein